METMGNSNYTQGNVPGIDEIDNEWDKKTWADWERLKSKDFEGMKYAYAAPRIEAIINEEFGFVPDLRRISLVNFESLKDAQRKVVALQQSKADKDGDGLTVSGYLQSMRSQTIDIAFDFNSPDWDKIEAKLRTDANGDQKEFVRLRNALMEKLRDRLAAEIQLLD